MDPRTEAYRRVIAGEPPGKVARETGVPTRTLEGWKAGRKPKGMDSPPAPVRGREFTLPDLPEDGRTAEEILEARKTVFKRKKDYYDSRELVDVTTSRQLTPSPAARKGGGDFVSIGVRRSGQTHAIAKSIMAAESIGIGADSVYVAAL